MIRVGDEVAREAFTDRAQMDRSNKPLNHYQLKPITNRNLLITKPLLSNHADTKDAKDGSISGPELQIPMIPSLANKYQE